MPADSRNTPNRLSRTSMRMLAVLLCALVVLAGCGTGSSSDTDDEGHRFATERRPTAPPTATSVATEEVAEALPTSEPTLVPEDALDVRGAPQFAYLQIDGALQAYDTVSRTFTPLKIPEDVMVLDFTSSPTGDRVGVLALAGEDVIVQFFGADGEALGESISMPVSYVQPPVAPVATPAATPLTTAGSNQLFVSWVPQGNAIVVSGPGVMLRVSMSGEIMPISRTGVTGTVVKALWSPMDSQVAILTQLMDGHQGVFMLDSGHDEARELEVFHLQPEQSLSNLQWLPNGLGMVVVAGNTSNGELMNGQLYMYTFGDPVPVLVATSGQGGPAATITHAVVSPDGHTVAYAIMVRDLDEWHLHSLWIRPLKGGPALSIPVESNAPITNILWTAEGLVWQQSNGQVTVIDGSLQPRPLGEEPAATPVASPVGTPVASPVSTPQATPESRATPRG